MDMNLLNKKDLEWLNSKGISRDDVINQVEGFRKGAFPVNLVRAATIGDGITRFSEKEEQELISLFSRESLSRKVIKFIPASGAATRMFAVLQKYEACFWGRDEAKSFAEVLKKITCKSKTLIKRNIARFIKNFKRGIKEHKFAFYRDLKEELAKDGFRIEELISRENFKTIIDYLLNSRGLNYANLPKALLKFHNYKDHSRTSLEEHLVEGVDYVRDSKKVVHIHITVSPEFIDMCKIHAKEVVSRYKKGGMKFDVQFSKQEPNTDTVAVDKKNNLFRDREKNLVLRPGGHGALIDNLNNLDGDIIFIKNIDNVAPDNLKAETIKYKKILGGHLLKIQEKVFKFLDILNEQKPTNEELDKIASYAKKNLNIFFPADFDNYQQESKKEFLIEKLDRPIRVCGMVKNEGEPGGGPFWVKDRHGTISLQIIEGVQIEKKSPAAVEILERSTHFNPVDLVCGIKCFRKKKFDLTKFVDDGAYFISKKSKEGRTLKAMERPGLWNGAMAGWITIFVEVPIETFNPVKTVNDLLRKEHTSVNS